MTVEERVAAGAAWLDENQPGWERRIDLATLDLASSCRCVLGQLFRGQLIHPQISGFSWAEEHFEINTPRLGFDIHDARQLSETGPEYAALDEAWIALLKERFDSGLLSDA